jgi:hypothetical protein
MITVFHSEKGSAWGGNIIIDREFFNPQTREYLHIEAHEIRNKQSVLGRFVASLKKLFATTHEQPPEDGHFMVAFWCNDGNDGDHGMNGDINHVVKSMQNYKPAPGMIEMDIPEDAWE